MKKFYLILLSFFIILSANANSMPDLKYKNIKNNDKIFFDSNTGNWSKKKTNSAIYFIKTKGFGDFNDYLDSNKDFAFSTECEYEFIYNNSLIGFSNRDMKFYDFIYTNGGLGKRELTKEEIQKIFPDHKIISISEFSQQTNSYKIKKHIGTLDVILLNDTNKTFDNYAYSSGNASFKQYLLKGFISISKPGMVQFSSGDKTSSTNPWYILLIR